jgi:arylformamidase
MKNRDIACWFGAAVGLIAILGCTQNPVPGRPAQRSSSVAITSRTFSYDWIDATATLDPATTPIYEGDAPLKFDFLKDMRKGDPLTLSAYSMGAHSGTHIDAPMHFVRDGATIDRVSLDPLIGPALVIDIADNVAAIDAAELNRHDWRGAERVLFRTRSSLRGWMSS